MDNLFKKFYQIDTTLTRKHGGTGLGLSICKGIVEAHNGTIWLDKGYNKGASFKFTLPKMGETVLKLLVIDDNKDLTEAIYDSLEHNF